MKRIILWLSGISAVLVFAGCESVPPGVERGPHGTIAYNVMIEASEPGVRIEANDQYIGNAPLNLKIFGDKDGTFHDFGSDYYVVRAIPVSTNQFVQTRVFRTGRWFGPEDRIPNRIDFDMNQRPPPEYQGYPGYPPGYYGPPGYYYGPRVYFGAPPVYFRFHGRYP